LQRREAGDRRRTRIEAALPGVDEDAVQPGASDGRVAIKAAKKPEN
jgi:HSP20 family molecular chaperone IbpA